MTFLNLGKLISLPLEYCASNVNSNGLDCDDDDHGEYALMVSAHWRRAFLHNLLLHQAVVDPCCLCCFLTISQFYIKNNKHIINMSYIVQTPIHCQKNSSMWKKPQVCRLKSLLKSFSSKRCLWTISWTKKSIITFTIELNWMWTNWFDNGFHDLLSRNPFETIAFSGERRFAFETNMATKWKWIKIRTNRNAVMHSLSGTLHIVHSREKVANFCKWPDSFWILSEFTFKK